MTLKTDERSAIVDYRLEKAIKTLKEAIDVVNLGYWNLAANRLYYATYYASSALLIHFGSDASTHKGVIRMIGKNFITNNMLKVEDSRLLGRLFTMRQSGDYDDLFDWEEFDILPMVPQVEDYIERIKTLITSQTESV